MTKGALVLCAVALLGLVALPAMADTTTFIGGDATSPTDWTTADNWVGGVVQAWYWAQDPVTGSWYQDFPDLVISSNCAVTSISNPGNFPIVGTLYDELPGSFSILGASGWVAIHAVVVPSGSSLNLGSAAAGAGPLTCTVGGLLTIQGNNGGWTGNGIASGGGTIDVSSTTCNWTVTDNTSLIANGTIFTGLSGVSAASLTVTGTSHFSAANFAFAGQINLMGALCDFNYNGDTSAVVGANIKLVGSAGNPLYINTPNQAFTDGNFTGDGWILATSPVTNPSYAWWMYDRTNTMTSQGSTFAPSNTSTAGGSWASGQMTFVGNLVCAQDTAGKNTQFVASVTGTTGLVGSGYTKFSAARSLSENLLTRHVYCCA